MENNNSDSNYSNFFKILNPNEIESIYKPTSVEETTFSLSFVLEEEETLEDEAGIESKNIVKVDAILHGNIKRTCYVAYAKFQYHAWVTLNGSLYMVEEISANMNSGQGEFIKKVSNVSSLKKLDEIYEYGNACRSATMVAVAKKGNATVTVRVKL